MFCQYKVLDGHLKRFLPLLWYASLVRPWFFHCPVPAAHIAFLHPETTEQLTSPIPSSHGVMAKGTPCQKLPPTLPQRAFQWSEISSCEHSPWHLFRWVSGNVWSMALPHNSFLGHFRSRFPTSSAGGAPADFSAIQQVTTAHFPTRSDLSAGGRSLGALSQPWGSWLLLIYTIPMLRGGFFGEYLGHF